MAARCIAGSLPIRDHLIHGGKRSPVPQGVHGTVGTGDTVGPAGPGAKRDPRVQGGRGYRIENQKIKKAPWTMGSRGRVETTKVSEVEHGHGFLGGEGEWNLPVPFLEGDIAVFGYPGDGEFVEVFGHDFAAGPGRYPLAGLYVHVRVGECFQG